MNPDLLKLVAARQGHFRLESGHHSSLWLDLESLFVDPAKVRSTVRQLGRLLSSQKFELVCGPLTGGAFLAQMLASDLGLEFCYTERVKPVEQDGFYAAQYRLPEAQRDRVRRRRVAIVDDAVSAGSAVRGTYAELVAHTAVPIVVGALLVLGTAASAFFDQAGIPIVSVARLPYDLWLPAECPLCAVQTPLTDAPGLTRPVGGRLTSA